MIYTAAQAHKIIEEKQLLEKTLQQEVDDILISHFRDVVTPRMEALFNRVLTKANFKSYRDGRHKFDVTFEAPIFYFESEDDKFLIQHFKKCSFFSALDFSKFVELSTKSKVYTILLDSFLSQVKDAGFEIQSINIKGYSDITTLTMLIEFILPAKGE